MHSLQVHQASGVLGPPLHTGREQEDLLLFRPRFRQTEAVTLPIDVEASFGLAPGVNPVFPPHNAFEVDVATPDGRTLPVQSAELAAELERRSGDAVMLRFSERSLSMVNSCADRLADTPRAREAIRTILVDAMNAGPGTPSMSPEMAAAYRTLNEELGLGADGPAGNPGADREPFDPDRALKNARLALPNLQVINRDVHVTKCAIEARYRARVFSSEFI